MNKKETEFGAFYYNDNNDPIINSLKSGVFFSKSNFEFLNGVAEKLKKSGEILDIGAHIGTFCPQCLESDIDISMVEAGTENFECLQKTFGSRKNVSLYNHIIYDKKSRADFSETKGPFGWLVENENGKFETETLDNLFKDKKVKAIKIDIEGSEIFALDGATEILKQRPVMLIEINGYCLMQKNKTSNDLLKKINEVGYDIFLPQKKLFKINPNNFFPFCVCDVLCISKKDSFKFDFDYLEEDKCLEIYKQMLPSYNNECRSYFKYIENKNHADIHI